MKLDAARRRADFIMKKFSARFMRLHVEATALAHSDAPLPPRAKRVIEIVDALAAIVAPHAPACRSGCSYCCHQAVVITRFEAEAISNAIGIAPAEVAPIESADDPALKSATYIAAHTGEACPFLEQGKCSIYDVRPIACKTQFNMGNDPTLCDIAKNPGGTVPYFNFKPLQFIVGMLAFNAREPVGDIRDFFPRGRGK